MADRAQRSGEHQVSGRQAPIRKNFDYPIDSVKLIRLVEQTHQPASQGGLGIPQLDGLRVVLDRFVGLALELGELGEQDEAAPPGRAPGGDLRGECA